MASAGKVCSAAHKGRESDCSSVCRDNPLCADDRRGNVGVNGGAERRGICQCLPHLETSSEPAMIPCCWFTVDAYFPSHKIDKSLAERQAEPCPAVFTNNGTIGLSGRLAQQGP